MSRVRSVRAERNSGEPMSTRLAPGEYEHLHHFISSGVWDKARPEAKLAAQADRRVGRAKSFRIIDDAALPKKEAHSVDPAPQYSSALGKTADRQTLVLITLARGEVPVRIGLRLFLPES